MPDRVDPAQVIASTHGAYVVAGRTYPRPLPPELAPWHCYTADGGHSLVVLLAAHAGDYDKPGADIGQHTVPAPVKSVLRAGWTVRADGFLVTDLPYDERIGLVTDPDDDELDADTPAGTEQHTYAVDKPYNPRKTTWPDGLMQWRLTETGVMLVLFLGAPTAREIEAVKSSPAQFALVAGQHALLLAHRFEPGLPWSDAPWQACRQDAPVGLPPIGQTGHLRVSVLLVDANTGIVKAIRQTSWPARFVEAVRAAMRTQALNRSTDAQGQAEIAGWYRRYRDSEELVGGADLTTELTAPKPQEGAGHRGQPQSPSDAAVNAGRADDKADVAERVDRLLKEFRHRYPDALAVCGDFADKRGQGDLDWPDWCWLPMAAVITYLTGTSPLAMRDIAKVAALTQWRLGRGVYELDDDVASTAVSELWGSAGGNATQWANAVLPPLETWQRLPEWCCYVHWPDRHRPQVPAEAGFQAEGVFVHLEYDYNTGRPELRLLIDTDGTWDGLVAVPLYLDRPNLGAAAADMSANDKAARGGAHGANVRSLTGLDGDPTALAGGLGSWLVLPLVLALIDPAARIVDRDSPGDQPRRAERRGGRWRPAPATRTWTITYDGRPTLRLVR